MARGGKRQINYHLASLIHKVLNVEVSDTTGA